MNFEFVTERLGYSADTQAIVALSSGQGDIFETPDDPVTFGNIKIAPWGSENDLPAQVMEKIRSNDVVAPNIQFNVQAGYAQGIKPMTRVIQDGKLIGYTECLDDRVLDFFQDNDVTGWFLEQLSDMVTFFNVFPEIILSKDGKQITGLRHLEAIHSRWACIDPKHKRITQHVYAEWEDGRPKKGEYTITPVLPRFNTYQELKDRMNNPAIRDRAYVMQVTMPTPGRTYYSHPYWWSVFKSGWYDLSAMLPAFKKALIKNHLAVRYIVYISDEFWKDLAMREKISPTDIEKMEEVKNREIRKILDFLSGADGKGGGMISAKKNLPGSNGKPFEDKYVQIETIKPSIEGGEFIEDAEEASNMISYAMGVHPNLNGATPGRSKGSLGGSDKRELFNIKSALMSPFRERLLMPLNLIKRYNAWPKDTVFAVPEHLFTTLDKNKSGSETKTNTP